MSSVTVDYDKLNAISKNASNAASRMNDYINDLSKKVTSKYGGITGGASYKTQNSEYYVNQKIAQLRTKKDQYSSFSSAVSTFATKAQETDRDVAKKIKASKNQFVDKHDYIKSDDWWAGVRNWFIDLKNSCPLFNAIGQLIENAFTGMKNLWADLKYWYKCGGGKQIIGMILAVAGAIAAVVILVGSFPISGIVAACAAIGAAIAAINAGFNVYTSYKAWKEKKNGDPAWAKIYGEQDTVQDYLRQTNFHDGTLNRLSYYGATGIDVVQTVCDVVAIYDGLMKIKNVFKEIKISAKKGNVSFGKRLGQYVFNTKSYMTDDKGKAMRWRKIIQDRGDLRTIRTNNIMYRVTKARTVAEYNKTLTSAQKLAKKAKKYNTYLKYIQKGFDYTLGGDASGKKIGKDVHQGLNKKFKILDLTGKLYDLKDKNWKSFNKTYKGYHVLAGSSASVGGR